MQIYLENLTVRELVRNMSFTDESYVNFQFYLEFIDVEKQLKVRFSPIFQSHLSENETVNSLHRYLDECQEIRSNRG